MGTGTEMAPAKEVALPAASALEVRAPYHLTQTGHSRTLAHTVVLWETPVATVLVFVVMPPLLSSVPSLLSLLSSHSSPLTPLLSLLSSHSSHSSPLSSLFSSHLF